jgi:hypothetical protein
MSKPLRKTKTLEESEIDPWKLFLNAMRSPVTRDRYSTRVAKFFDFIEIPGRTLEQKAVNFARKGRNDAAWAFSAILKFVYYQRKSYMEKKRLKFQNLSTQKVQLYHIWEKTTKFRSKFSIRRKRTPKRWRKIH